MFRVPPRLVTLFAAVVVFDMASTAHSDTAERQRETIASQRSTICKFLGKPIKAGTSSTSVDLNGDGFINVLDAAIFRLREAGGTPLSERSVAEVTESPRVAGGEQIIVEPMSTTILSGNQVAVLFLLRSNATPLLGYTFDVKAVASSGAVGTISPNVMETNFFDSRNVITAAGAARDPFFSVIQDDGEGGVSITTMTDDLSTLLAVDGVNDAFGQVVFDVPSGTKGDFLLTLASGSAVSDAGGQPIPFTFTPGTVRVLNRAEVPTLSSWGVGILALTLLVVGTLAVGRIRNTGTDIELIRQT